MKTKNHQKIFVTFLVTFMIVAFTNQVNAGNYKIVYLDSIQAGDTAAVCDNLDSIKVIPMNGLKNSSWQYYEGNNSVTLNADTLYLKGDYNSVIDYHGFDGVNEEYKWIGIQPLNLSIVQDFYGYNYISCNVTTSLSAVTNFEGNAQFSWNPLTGLDDPNIANPVATITSNVKYVVTVTIAGGCVVKDSITVTLNPMSAPQICIVGVDSFNKNRIIWDKPVSQLIDSFFIFKETKVTNVYKKIGAVGYNKYSLFTDTVSYPEIQSDRYKVSYKDVCGLESYKCFPHKTMHLSVNKGQNDMWNLIWEPYEGFTVWSYNIYRGTNSSNLEQIGATSGGGATQYSDLNPPAGDVLYQVEVVSPNNCNPWETSNKKAAIYSTSRSNIARSNGTDIHETISRQRQFSIWPNPPKDRLFIESKQIDIKNGIVEISDIEGKIIQKIALKLSKMEMDISNMKSGFYFVKIKTDVGITTQKIVKK
jgi:hypothetical protein